MKNKKDRMVVLITYAAIIVLIFAFSCTFMPDYIILREYSLQFSIVFMLGVMLGVVLGELI